MAQVDNLESQVLSSGSSGESEEFGAVSEVCFGPGETEVGCAEPEFCPGENEFVNVVSKDPDGFPALGHVEHEMQLVVVLDEFCSIVANACEVCQLLVEQLSCVLVSCVLTLGWDGVRSAVVALRRVLTILLRRSCVVRVMSRALIVSASSCVSHILVARHVSHRIHRHVPCMFCIDARCVQNSWISVGDWVVRGRGVCVPRASRVICWAGHRWRI